MSDLKSVGKFERRLTGKFPKRGGACPISVGKVMIVSQALSGTSLAGPHT